MERLCRCVLGVPTNYNPEPGEDVGRLVEPETMLEIEMAIRRECPAYTNLGVFTGHWEGQTENSIRYEVAVPLDRIEALRRVVITIGQELGQRAMYFDVGSPTVEIIPIDPVEPRNESTAEGR